jgi:hypothetical protein
LTLGFRSHASGCTSLGKRKRKITRRKIRSLRLRRIYKIPRSRIRMKKKRKIMTRERRKNWGLTINDYQFLRNLNNL